MILIGWYCVYLIFLSFFLYLSIALSFSSLSCNFNYNSSFIDFHLLSKLLSSSMCVCFGMFLFLTFSFSSLFFIPALWFSNYFGRNKVQECLDILYSCFLMIASMLCVTINLIDKTSFLSSLEEIKERMCISMSSFS